MSQNNNTELTTEQQSAVIDTKESVERLEAVILDLGQVRAFDFLSKLVTVSNLRTLQNIKESKSYKGLTYRDEDNKLVTVSSWDEFCQHKLQISRKTIDNNLLNFNEFGEEFFEASQRIGLGTRELRKLRQLPEEDQTLIIESEAIDSGDKEAVKELIEDLTDKHAKEKKALETKVTEATTLANVRDTLVQGANAEAQTAKVQLAEALEAQQFSPTKWLKTVQQINLASSKLLGDVVHAISQLLELNETVSTELMNDQHGDTALEMMATVQLHNVNEAFMLANNLSYETRERFGRFTTLARPMHTEEEILALEQELLAQL
jgi:hypothetical protein